MEGLQSRTIAQDPVGHGILKKLKSPSNLLCILLLADVLPILAKLSLFSQNEVVHLGRNFRE